MNNATRVRFALIVLVLMAPVVAYAQTTFPDFCSTSDFTLNGSAASLNPNANCVLRLTNALSQGGSAFLTSSTSLASDASFSTFFSFQITNPIGGSDSDGQGADGIVFVIQTVANNVGGSGGGIGYQGIGNSVGVEFDTWDNGEPGGGNHVGIDLNGSVTSAVSATVEPRLNDGNVWYAWVDYNGVTDLLELRISQSPSRPASPYISHTVDLVSVLGATDAFVGFTSGTGAAGNNHEILSWQFNAIYDPIGEPEHVHQVPTASEWGLLTLAGLLVLAGLTFIRSR